jgi:hypothetical protein
VTVENASSPRAKLGLVVSLAAVFVGTILLICVALEGGARLAYPEHSVNRCMVPSTTGLRFKPNCVSDTMKLWEGPAYTYQANDCGYRSADPCRPLPAGGLRVAVLGTSVAQGMFVTYPETFSARAEAMLKARCRAPVDFQNVSLPGAAIVAAPQWHHLLERMPEALALKPAAVISILSSVDLKYYNAPPWEPTTSSAAPGDKPRKGGLQGLARTLQSDVASSRSVMAMRSVMFHNGGIYLSHYLQEPDDSGYLYKTLSPKWEMRLKVADAVLGAMAQQAKTAGVPYIVIYYPSYPQAIAVSRPNFAPGFAPTGFDDRLGAIVRAHGGQFVDLTQTVGAAKDVPGLFYISNDHPNREGNRLLADEVVKILTRNVPAFAACGGRA